MSKANGKSREAPRFLLEYLAGTVVCPFCGSPDAVVGESVKYRLLHCRACERYWKVITAVTDVEERECPE